MLLPKFVAGPERSKTSLFHITELSLTCRHPPILDHSPEHREESQQRNWTFGAVFGQNTDMAGTTETVIHSILTDIDSGLLNPGDLIEESTLTEALGVSRTPVREAILRLETDGLIIRLPRKGAKVFKPTLEEFLAILEVHAKLEGLAAGLAARRLSKDHAGALEEIVKRCEAHAKTHGDGKPDAYYQLNLRFHEVVALAAGNPFLTELIKTNARKLMAYYRARYHYKGVIAASAMEHREIAGLILNRDSEAAEKCMATHVAFDHVTAMDLLAALS